MNQLIQINQCRIGQDTVSAVSARALHGALEVAKDFSDWVKMQLDDFELGADYEVFHQKGENGGRPRIEYILSVDCAKSIAMMSRTERGKEVRAYFIECEKVANQSRLALPDFSNPAIAARAWADEVEQKQVLQLALESVKPHVEFVEKYAQTNGSLGFRQVCKLLKANERDFKTFLNARGIMYSLGGVMTPYSVHVDAGRIEVKAGIATANDHAFTQARFTPKGVTWVAGEWAKFNLNAVVAA